jgi:hypothetical protein
VPFDQDVAVRRINGIDPSWSMLIVNDDLHTLSKEYVSELLGALDLEVYVKILADTFTGNWKNESHEEAQAQMLAA